MTEADDARPAKSERREPVDETIEVAPGILRIMLPVNIPGLGHVNCYALEDQRGVALVDPGVPDGVTQEVLKRRLIEVGLDPADVHTCVTTHSHIDHYGGITRLRALDFGRDIAVVAHRNFGRTWWDTYDDASEDSADLSLRLDDEIDASVYEEMSRRLARPTRWGATGPAIPGRLLREWSHGISIRDALRPPEPTHPVDDGDIVELGDREWLALHTPGHADDHLCLWNAELGVLFAGDHVLPDITPHIGGRSGHDDPLDAFFDSLERVAALEGATLVLPAHGDPFTDLSGRALDIAAHHRGRLDRIRALGTELGTATVDQVMQALFSERSWGPLAAAETYAHLEWLRIHEGVPRTEVAGIVYYRL